MKFMFMSTRAKKIVREVNNSRKELVDFGQTQFRELARRNLVIPVKLVQL